MRRREFIAGLGSVAAWPVVGRAQQSSKIHRVAWVSASEPVADMNESSGDRGYRAFLEELRQLGSIEGRNLILERYSDRVPGSGVTVGGPPTFTGVGRAGQLAIAGRLTAGSSLNGAMVSRVM